MLLTNGDLLRRPNEKGRFYLSESQDRRFDLALRLHHRAKALRAQSPSLSIPVVAFYRIYTLFVLHIDIPTSTQISSKVRIFHGTGLVIHPASVIEDDVQLRQTTTIGGDSEGRAPIIRRGASIGANCVLLGAIEIGAYAVVGAGSVVTKNVSAGETVAGNPARPLNDKR